MIIVINMDRFNLEKTKVENFFRHERYKILPHCECAVTLAPSFHPSTESQPIMNLVSLLFFRFREALPYLVHACNLNTRLLNPNNPGQAMNEQLLTHWRRVCFLRLNEFAVQMFERSDWTSVCGGLELVSELVIPCIPKLSASPQAADSVAVEQVRNCWCNFLASPLDGKLYETGQRYQLLFR